MSRYRVLLVSMPDSFMGFNIAARLPNLGLVSIAANTDNRLAEVSVLDLILRQKNPLAALKKAMDKVNPDFVGLNCMSFQYYSAKAISRWIKTEYNPDIKIIMGGYHPTLCYEEIGASPEEAAARPDMHPMNTNPWCDFIIRGEGELTFTRFLKAYSGDAPLASVKGLSWRGSDGRMNHNPPAPITDLNRIKLPDRNARLIKKGYHIIGKPGDTVETSRGCTNTCKFCSIRRMYGRGIRYYDLKRVIDDIKAAVDAGARSVLFIDDNITLDPARLEKLCDMIIAEGLNDIEYHTQAGAAGLIARKTLIPKMGKAGFSVVFFGIENIKKSNLKMFSKSIPLKKLKYLTRMLHKHGMISFGGFILGNPDDRIEDIRYNLEFARYLDLDFPAFQVLNPYPKTELREELDRKGLITNKFDYSRYNGLYANVKTKFMDVDTLQKELLRCYFRYYTPSWLLARLGRRYLLRKYFRYFMEIVRKYWKIALKSWMAAYIPRIFGLKPEESENNVLKLFERIRDERALRRRLGPINPRSY